MLHAYQRVESRWIQVADLLMHMRVSTEKVPVDALTIVLVHGVGVSSRYMVPLARHLALHYQVYAPDLPGFGKSAKTSKVLNIAELSDALYEWMQVMQLEQAVLIRNSLGCQIIVEFAARHPEQLLRAVQHSPAIDPAMGGLLHHIVRLPLVLPYEHLSLTFVLACEYWQAGLGRVECTFHYAQKHPIESNFL
jgi:2-hydroxy-6-oxonona-2,4-dienedioate hydrolase